MKLVRTISMTLSLSLVGVVSVSSANARSAPGDGVEVAPIGTSTANTVVATNIASAGLSDLGYSIEEYKESTPAIIYTAIGNGDATYTAGYWNPLHASFLEKTGGFAASVGNMTTGALQGYLIDKKTADAYGISSLEDFKKPEIAALFDTDGDGKANLTGCNPGWGCEKVIEHHLDEYGIRDFFNHDQGSYFALIADTIARQQSGESIFYYTWTPQWVSSVLKPGEISEWVEVPYYSAPDGNAGVVSKLADGRDLGFAVNTVQIVANQEFLDENPAAAKLFELMEVPISDINAIMLKVRNGEKSPEDLMRHATDWISANQGIYNSWLDEARAAK